MPIPELSSFFLTLLFNMKYKSFFTGCLLIIVALTGCNKDETSSTTNPPTISEALKGNKWQLNSLIVYQPAGTPILNLTTINFKPCELDNYFEFGIDSIFRESENILICNPQGNSVFHQLDKGPWLVNEATDTLTIGAGFIFRVYKVTQWSNSTMKWEQAELDYFGQKMFYEYSFKSIK